MPTPTELEAYVFKRNAAVTAGFDSFLAFAKQQGISFTDTEVAQVTFHKVRTAIASLDPELKAQSRAWLVERKFQPWS